MSNVKVLAFSVSLDGFGAGPGQDLDNPLGVRGEDVHAWSVTTAAFRTMHGSEGGREGVDSAFIARSFENVGAWVMGRNMFGPIRGPWMDDSWRGWWGEEPPFHVPVYVLTHYARAPLVMSGGTTFHFVTDGAQAALERAKEAARGKDVRIGGGVATVREYVAAGAIDELHLAFAPVMLGSGEHLFAGIDLPKLGFSVAESTAGEEAFHVVLRK